MTKKVVLSDEPKGKEFEEFATSYLQAVGYYTERNIIEKGETEVLELDTITTDYAGQPPESTLIEFKSGDWGFPDIFKVKGWLSYLNINKAVFICSKGKENATKNEFYMKKCSEIGIDLIIIEKLEDTQLYLKDYLKEKEVETIDI